MYNNLKTAVEHYLYMYCFFRKVQGCEKEGSESSHTWLGHENCAQMFD